MSFHMLTVLLFLAMKVSLGVTLPSREWPWDDSTNSALSPDDESIKDEDLYFDQSNERIIEGASSPDMSATNSSSDSVTNGLWGIRIKIEALDVIPEEFRY